MSWTVHAGRGSLLVFTNATGGTVTDVEMRLRGKALGGMFGRPDWSVKIAEMADGDATEAPFRATSRGSEDPPRMEIEWTDRRGDRWETVLTDLPL